jgi:uncharacterized delta-60 repeat protein
MMRKIEFVLAPLAALALVLSLAAALPATPALAAGEVELVELWHKAYDGGYGDEASDVAVDSEDNIIVTGYTTNEAGNTSYYTIKYDKDGNEIWSKSYDGGNDDEAYGVAVDSEDNIIVTGFSRNATGNGKDNYYTIKYDKDGNEIWNKSYADGQTDQAMAVAVDSQDNIIVTGCSRNLGVHYLTIKYDKDGNEIWNQTYHDCPISEAFGVAVDSEDNVIVTGQSCFPNGDWHTIKYNGTDGSQIWLVTWGGGGDNEGHRVALDSEGNIIVTGTRQHPPYGPYSDVWDYHTIKYDPNGKEIWGRTYWNGYANWPMGLAVDSADNVIVTGYSSDGSTESNYYTIIYDKDGNEIASATYDSGFDDEAMGVAVDSEGNIIVTGYSTNENGNKDYYTIKYETVPAGCGGLCGGAIAGIAVGAFVAGGLISYFVVRRRAAGR